MKINLIYGTGGKGAGKRALLIFFLLLSAGGAFAQENTPALSRQESVDAFSRADYELAYNGFSQLLGKFPKDPLYKYYAGACLVEMKAEPDKALNMLQQSVTGASVVRSLPPEAFFYLGRAQQMNGQFSEAIESFNLFTGQVGKKAARELNVPDYIQECGNGKGMIAVAVKKPSPSETSGKVQIKSEPVQTTVKDKPMMPAEKEKTVQTELSPENEKILDDAVRLQYKADSLNAAASEKKTELENLPEKERASLRLKISQDEMLAASYQKSADTKYSEAQERINTGRGQIKESDTPIRREPVKDSVRDENKAIAQQVKADTVKEAKQLSSQLVGIFSYFEILSGDEAYPDEKIQVDPEVPDGLIYRIQLAVFRNPVAPVYFKGITPVYGFRIAGTDKTNYYAGMFRRSADARKALTGVKEIGFRDAFIVSFDKNRPVSAERAAILENEWGSKPFAVMNTGNPAADTLLPTLVFRVEVARSLKAMKPDVLENLKTMAGGRGLDIIRLGDGNFVYLIGKFITFESAAEYSDLLVRNNYRNAKVVAWLGNKEVPVETARQLFNNIK